MTKETQNHINTSFFHIMVQGLNKEYIFKNDVDKNMYLKYMNKIIKEIEIDIIVYCIMDNHVHLLVKIENVENMSKFMQRLNTLYARYYNKKYKRVGYVFRDRYKKQIIYSEKQLYTCINYIHNNPIKAKICKNQGEYKYSSFNEYIKNTDVFNDYFINLNPIREQYDKHVFIEIEEDEKIEIERIIKDYLNYKNLSLENLIKYKQNLKEIVNILKLKYNLSIRKISEYLNISRETIRKIAK